MDFGKRWITKNGESERCKQNTRQDDEWQCAVSTMINTSQQNLSIIIPSSHNIVTLSSGQLFKWWCKPGRELRLGMQFIERIQSGRPRDGPLSLPIALCSRLILRAFFVFNTLLKHAHSRSFSWENKLTLSGLLPLIRLKELRIFFLTTRRPRPIFVAGRAEF